MPSTTRGSKGPGTFAVAHPLNPLVLQSFQMVTLSCRCGAVVKFAVGGWLPLSARNFSKQPTILSASMLLGPCVTPR